MLYHFENLHKTAEVIGSWKSKPLFYNLENHYQTSISDTSLIKNMYNKIHERRTNIITGFFCSFSQLITSLQLSKMHDCMLRTTTAVCIAAPLSLHDKANQIFQLAWKAKVFFSKICTSSIITVWNGSFLNFMWEKNKPLNF